MATSQTAIVNSWERVLSIVLPPNGTTKIYCAMPQIDYAASDLSEMVKIATAQLLKRVKEPNLPQA